MAKGKWGTKRKLKENKEPEGYSRKILSTKGQKSKSPSRSRRKHR